MRHRWVAACLLVYIHLGLASAHSSYSSSFAALLSNKTVPSCEPGDVPFKQRCAYVLAHHKACSHTDGLLPYLTIHFCYLQASPWASLTLLTVWIGFLFMVMMAVSEKFFCPSLELLSDYLRLPANVAGATLLAFGNGANDVFTQFAAASQGGAEALQMSLGEPIGGGLFVTNVVFAAIILLSRTPKVKVMPMHFMKDVLFYLGAILIVLLVLLDQKITLLEVGVLLTYYSVYVAATLWLTRNDEPVHANPAQHELPPEINSDDESIDSDWDPQAEAAANLDDAAHLTAPLLTFPSHPLATTPSPPSPRTPLFAGPPSPTSPVFNNNTSTNNNEEPPPSSLFESLHIQTSNPPTPSDTSVHGPSPRDPAPASPGSTSPPPSPSLKHISVHPRFPPDDLPPSLRIPQFRSTSPPSRARSQIVNGYSTRSRASSPNPRSHWLSSPRKWQRRWWQQLKSHGLSRRLLQEPLIAALSCTMPRVSTAGHPYWKGYAMVLPLLGPPALAYGLGLTDSLPPSALAYGAACGLFGTFLVWSLYPSHGALPPRLTICFTVLSFFSSICWLNTAAGELVAACLALGRIAGLSPALLGATVLAWGNSMGDLVADTAMARDGYPSIALAGCFASPLFQMLAGVSAAFFGPSLEGPVRLTVEAPLFAMYAAGAICLVVYACLAPAFKFRLPRWTGYLALGLYTTAQATYLYLIFSR